MSDSPETIAVAGNVEVPAYRAIQSLGYTITRERKADEDQEWWIATKKNWKFIATSPLELLGLIAMRNERGRHWKAEDPEIDRYLKTYYPEGLE